MKSRRLLAFALIFLSIGCCQSAESLSKDIRPGTSLADVESRIGKADEVIDAHGRIKSANKLYIYKKLDDRNELWVTVGGDGKVVWATTHDKASKAFTG